MQVLYDNEIFELQKTGGISRYICALIQYSQGYTPKIFARYTNNAHLQKLFPSMRPPRTLIEKLLVPNFFNDGGRFHRILKKIKLAQDWMISSKCQQNALLLSEPYDLVHMTYYSPELISTIMKKPIVVTIHDMTVEKFPDLIPCAQMYAERKKHCCEKAKRIIAVSESTKTDIISFMNINEDKIDVVYHANPLHDVFMAMPSIKLPINYLLYVGSRSKYKNFAMLARSMSIVMKADKTLSFLCVGSPFMKEEVDLLKSLDIFQKTFSIQASDPELSYIYRNASLLAYPSLSEGFGLPILEAFSCGCPVILSNIPVFREIASDCAIFFDPKDINDIAKTINDVIYDNNLKESLRKKARQRSNEFSWETTINKTASVYRHALS